MDIPESILKRRSIRSFIDRELSDESVYTLIEAACLAPSAGHRQPWGFVVVREPPIKEKLVEAAYGQSFIATAPVVIVICVDPARSIERYGDRGATLYCLQDTAAATENILLTAAHNSLGACWIGAFDEAKAAVAIGLPKGIRPIAMIPIGYPSKEPPMPPRRPLTDVIHLNRW